MWAFLRMAIALGQVPDPDMVAATAVIALCSLPLALVAELLLLP